MQELSKNLHGTDLVVGVAETFEEGAVKHLSVSDLLSL
jgi:hypothetical protein